MARPTIASTSPVSGAVGVPINTTISIIFDQEVDTYRLENGGIILEGPDESQNIGPSFIHSTPPQTDEDEFLSSPDLKGIKNCTYSFLRVDGDGNSVPYYDYGSGINAGSIYRTKVVITPTQNFAGLTEYSVYLVGDTDLLDDDSFGIAGRTVYDTAKGANIGNGEALFYGGYTGSVRDQFHIEIATGGAVGTATYEWWTNGDLVHRTGTTSTGYRLLSNGTKVKFLPGLTYSVGDEFSVWCDVPLFMDGSYTFSFTTADYEAETLPIASSILTGIDGTSPSVSATSTINVLETSPSDRDYNVDPDTTTITITFDTNLDSSTVTSSTVSVESFPVNESTDGSIEATGILTNTLSVSGSIITITLGADQLYTNNLVVVTLDTTIADADGNSLGEDYEFFFSTEFSPFYSGVRMVRLRLGGLGNSFPNETIALAIWEASTEADALAPASIIDAASYNHAKGMFVNCLASQYLVSGAKGAGGGARKRLADFDVSRDTGGLGELTTDLSKCLDRYELAMRTGGDAGYGTSLRPVSVVKGDYDPDNPPFGRVWEIPATPIVNSRTSWTGYRRWYKTNIRKS